MTGNITQSGSVNTNLLGIYTIIYSVTDSHGNSSNITRTVNVVDTQAPVMTNPNASPLKMIVGQTLNLQTVTCSDNYDTNCSIIQSGAVDTNTVGMYTITYTATDSSGNTVTQTQIIEVQPTYYAGGGTGGGGRSRDVCPNGDSSGNLYDGTCEIQTIIPQTPVTPITPKEEKSEEENTNETPVTTPEEEREETNTENPETILEKETEEGQSYTLKNDFQSCKIIDDILDENYVYSKNGVFTDEQEAQYKDILLKFAQIGIIDGYEDGSVKPNQKMTRAEFLKVALISHCYTYRELEGKTGYSDTQEGSWQSKVIEKSETLKMVNGYEDGTFQADTEISKAEAVKVLMRLSFVYAKTPIDLQYEDVKVNWHQNYVRTGETL